MQIIWGCYMQIAQEIREKLNLVNDNKLSILFYYTTVSLNKWHPNEES